MSATRRTIEFWGKAGTTIAEASTDAAQDLDTGTALAFKNSDGKIITGLFITCTTHPIRYAFTATPVESGLGHVLPKDQAPVLILGAANIRAFKYISATTGNHAAITFTPLYGDE